MFVKVEKNLNLFLIKKKKRHLVNWWYFEVFPHKLRKDIKKFNYRTLRRLLNETYQ